MPGEIFLVATSKTERNSVVKIGSNDSFGTLSLE